MSFGVKLVKRRRNAPNPPGRKHACECFDCVRAEGLTPPTSLRGNHKALYPTPMHKVTGKGVDIPSDGDFGGIIDHRQLIDQQEKTDKRHKGKIRG